MITRIAYLGIGSNLGYRAVNLAESMDRLSRERDIALCRVSQVYESAPWGPVRAQEPFYNAVAEIRTPLDPPELLTRCLAIEQQMGRRRIAPRGPRNIDLDLLLVDSMVGRWPGLDLPHAHLAARAFVLRPLLELSPNLVDPRTQRRLSETLPQLVDQQLYPLGPLGPLAATERAAAGRS